MEELTRKSIEEKELRHDGGWQGSFDPLAQIPMDEQAWYEHVEDRVLNDVPDGFGRRDVVAETTIDKVSYTDPETGECDVRFEARYEVTWDE